MNSEALLVCLYLFCTSHFVVGVFKGDPVYFRVDYGSGHIYKGIQTGARPGQAKIQCVVDSQNKPNEKIKVETIYQELTEAYKDINRGQYIYQTFDPYFSYNSKVLLLQSYPPLLKEDGVIIEFVSAQD